MGCIMDGIVGLCMLCEQLAMQCIPVACHNQCVIQGAAKEPLAMPSPVAQPLEAAVDIKL
jgi:hypothetical protein